MRILPTLLSAALIAVATACGPPDSFRIQGEIADAPTMNLRLVYSSPRGVVSAVTASRDGKFRYEGAVTRPSVVEIFDNEYRLLGRIVAANGEDISVRLDRANPYAATARGDKTAERWTEWLSARADELRSATPSARNALIASYVAEHPADIVSALLVMTSYDSAADPAGAARLWASIDAQARPAYLTGGYTAQLERVDSAALQEPIAPIPYMRRSGKMDLLRPKAAPVTLIAITGAGREGRDSVLAMLRRAARHRGKGRLEVIDLSLAPDTVEWRRTVETDSATWSQGWIAGGINASAIGRLGLPTVPYFIVTDSAGACISATSEASQALSAAIANLD